MLVRPRLVWAAARDSLWFIPTILTILSSCLAFLLISIDHEQHNRPPLSEWENFAGGPEASRAVLSAIAGSLVTVTGVVFSVTIVALQLASSQFTPSILRNFTADRSNQIVLGVFISTFTYTLLVLRAVRTEGQDQTEFVPILSVLVAMVLMLISIAFLIYFFHHGARSMQASVILHRVATNSLRRIDELFPDALDDPQVDDPVELPPGRPHAVGADVGGYIQAVNSNDLYRLAKQRGLVIRMTQPVGDFVIQGQTIAEVWGPHPLDHPVQRLIQSGFIIGSERTPEQDIEYGLVEIADMAVKALSSAINDPTTAKYCIDRLTQILAVLGNRKIPAANGRGDEPIPFIARYTTFTRALKLAFGPILHFGEGTPLILDHLLHSFEVLAALLPAQHAKDVDELRHKIEQLANSDSNTRRS